MIEFLNTHPFTWIQLGISILNIICAVLMYKIKDWFVLWINVVAVLMLWGSILINFLS